MPSRLSRRAVLRGAGGVAVGLPFLSAMLSPLRTHADGSIPKRLIIFFTSNGTIPEAWTPTGGETDFQLSPILSPLASHREDLLILKGIDMRSALEFPGGANGHDVGTGHCLTPYALLQGPSGVGEFGHLWDGSAGGQSFDQYVADRLGSNHAFSSLVFGVQSDIAMSIPARISWKQPFEPVRPMQEPALAYARVFGSGAQDADLIERSRAQRLSVVDAVLDEYNRLYARVGNEDRQRLEAHIESLHEVEQSIERLNLGACDLPVFADTNDLLAVGQLNLDMMVAALSCDVTPVVVHQWGCGQSYRAFTHLNQEEAHHSLSHEPLTDTEAVEKIIAINTWYAEQFSELLDKMKGIEAGDGQNLLDHSVVMWVNELGNGYSHSPADVPYVLAGRANGALNTGRFLQYENASHGELFAAVGQALGLATQSFGMEEVFTAPLTNLLS